MERAEEGRGGGGRGRHRRGQRDKKPLGTPRAAPDPVLKFVSDVKKIGEVHCVDLSRTHMRASVDEPLSIMISPLLFRYIYDFDHEGGHEPVRELGLAYHRLFQIFEATDYIPPLPVNIPFDNETIESFTKVSILPGLLYGGMFKDAMPPEMKASTPEGKSMWINDEENMPLVPFAGADSAVFFLTGSDSCVHHEANMTTRLVNSALLYYNILSKLRIPVSRLYQPSVQVIVQPRQETDPPHLHRVLLAVTVSGVRSEMDPEKMVSEKDQEYIEGRIGWSYSQKKGGKKPPH